MKLLITGGHVTPALAVIDKLMSRPDTRIVFVGRKYSLESEEALSLEYKEIVKRNIPFRTLTAGRLTRVLTVQSLLHLLKVPVGFIQAYSILREESPNIVLSFGGYLALPVAIAAWLLGIPVYTHEQTIRPGLSNRIIARFSKRVFYAFPEAKSFFPSSKAVMTGNPVRPSIFQADKQPFSIPQGLPVIYVTGGSLGSHGINEHIKALLPELLKDFFVIHQIGSVKQYDDFERLKRYRRSLPDELKVRYYPVEHLFDGEIGYVYSVADLVIGRAGANTFFELLHLKKPAIFIPLPWSSNQEQLHHAMYFKKLGIGEIFEQKEPSEKLLEQIRMMYRNLAAYQKRFEELPIQYKKDAADIIISEIANRH